MLNKVKNIKDRIYSDYFMGERFKEYEDMLLEFKNNGFEFANICDADKYMDDDKKVLFIRHDIDSEPDMARRFFEIEKKYDVLSTYYFRLCSIDLDFIYELVKSGFEVGYHYEELATYAKDNNINDGTEVEKRFPEIRQQFEKNFEEFEKRIDRKIVTIVSHGDWKNRQLNKTNKEIVTDDLRKKLGIKYEAYSIEDRLDFRFADRTYPVCWSPYSPKKVLSNDSNRKGLVLIHPRQWCSNPKERFKQDFSRLLRK